MYIYHALTNALKAHMIHMNLNMTFYTHVEHSPTKTVLHKVLYGEQKMRVYILNTFWNGEPVQFFQERCWVVVTGCQENESCNKVLNFLERFDDRIRCTNEETSHERI